MSKAKTITPFFESVFDTTEPKYLIYRPKQYLSLFVTMSLASFGLILIMGLFGLLGLIDDNLPLKHVFFVWFELNLFLVLIWGGWLEVLFGWYLGDEPASKKSAIPVVLPSTGEQAQAEQIDSLDNLLPANKSHVPKDFATSFKDGLTRFEDALERALKIKPPDGSNPSQEEKDPHNASRIDEVPAPSNATTYPMINRVLGFLAICVYSLVLINLYGFAFEGAPYFARGFEWVMWLR
ncbi:hypothetical protein [Thiomicrospira microaerophila]|uniref:hypothetical protein n=1 Tax=Thiomicrospira microaerophila TaxID=406020 RepID=UPI0005CA3746|nr:hypothetical protein [Thiomicrospira microaerophila]